MVGFGIGSDELISELWFPLCTSSSYCIRQFQQMLSVLVAILPSVMETNVHTVITLIFVMKIHVPSVSSIVADVMAIYVTDVRKLVVNMHVRLQTVLPLVPVFQT